MGEPGAIRTKGRTGEGGRAGAIAAALAAPGAGRRSDGGAAARAGGATSAAGGAGRGAQVGSGRGAALRKVPRSRAQTQRPPGPALIPGIVPEPRRSPLPRGEWRGQGWAGRAPGARVGAQGHRARDGSRGHCPSV